MILSLFQLNEIKKMKKNRQLKLRDRIDIKLIEKDNLNKNHWSVYYKVSRYPLNLFKARMVALLE